MIIGICGGSGSGKTTLLKKLAADLGHKKPTLFSLDNYYKPIHQQEKDENGEYNFDLPTALDQQKAEKDLEALKLGQTVEVKEYFFNAPPDKNVLITLEPSPVIIVEGLFLFHYEGIRNLMDFSIFMEVDFEVQKDRRLYRDQETRGYSRDAILYQWENHVMPCYDKYLAPYKNFADFRFQNTAQFDGEYQRLKLELISRI
jgi:uridine kinase